MGYAVETEVFAGPFDLLLHLILKQEVDLYEVSLTTIVDSYLAEVERIDTTDLEVATEFLLIAATLIELKTRRLLPIDDSIDLDEELGIWEERDLLLSRLLECKTFKDAATVLRKLSMQASRTYPRTAGLDESYLNLAPDLLEGVDASDIRRAYIKAVTPKPKPTVAINHIAAIKANVTDAIQELLEELPRSKRISFRELTNSIVDRIEVVVRFLAILELFKQGAVELDQPSTFGDIEIIWTGDDAGLADYAVADGYEG